MNAQQQIEQQIQEHKVVLYMKGDADFPQCGFSARAVNILQECGVEFLSVDVLQDDAIRQGIKDFSQWPTIPQLYVNGAFVGGCDIMNQLHDQDELRSLINEG